MPSDEPSFAARLATWLALLLLCHPLLAAESGPIEDLPPLDEPPSNWIKTLELRAWSGYKDNVLLGNRNTVGSVLGGFGADLMLFRLPSHGWEYTLLCSGEYVRYFTASVVDHEATILLLAQASKKFGEGWKAGLSTEYFFFDQVFDGSVYEDVLTPVQILGNSVTLRPSLSKALGRTSRLELELPGTRQQFEEFIDNFWEFGPKLSWLKTLEGAGELGLSYQFSDRIHDTRYARDEEGTLETGRPLRFYEHEVGLALRQFWDRERRWRTTTKLSLTRNEDSGGYYQYWRQQLSEQLRLRIAKWEWRADARLSYYHYDHQRIGAPDSSRREKIYLRLGFRVERALTKKLKAFGQFEHERAIANLPFDRYRVNTISVGLQSEF